MAFTKKTWVNVPDPDNYTGDIPLSDLPRFDANNMNRIEDGIKEHIEDMVLHNKSDEGGALGLNSSATSGGAVGESAKTSSGGAVGYKASTTTGAAVGSQAETTEGGAALGSSASATKGGAAGVTAKETGGGGAIGYKASSTNGGGAIGDGATANYGGAVGKGASAEGGGAVGINASTDYGFAGGQNASAGVGGAAGSGASAVGGGAVGSGAFTDFGFAGGQMSSAAEGGGAVGGYAKAGKGFAGGISAKAVDANDKGIDAIQLGTGTNTTPRSMKVYDHTLMNPDGSIPNQRMFTLLKTVDINLSTPKGVASSSINITGVDFKKYSEFELVFNGSVSLYWHYEATTEGHAAIKIYIGDCTLCEIWQEITGIKEVNTNFPTVANLNFRYSGFTYLISKLDSSLNPMTPERRFTGSYVSPNGVSATTEAGNFVFKVDSGHDHNFMDGYNAAVVGTLYIYGKEMVE